MVFSSVGKEQDDKHRDTDDRENDCPPDDHKQELPPPYPLNLCLCQRRPCAVLVVLVVVGNRRASYSMEELLAFLLTWVKVWTESFAIVNCHCWSTVSSRWRTDHVVDYVGQVCPVSWARVSVGEMTDTAWKKNNVSCNKGDTQKMCSASGIEQEG